MFNRTLPFNLNFKWLSFINHVHGFLPNLMLDYFYTNYISVYNNFIINYLTINYNNILNFTDFIDFNNKFNNDNTTNFMTLLPKVFDVDDGFNNLINNDVNFRIIKKFDFFFLNSVIKDYSVKYTLDDMINKLLHFDQNKFQELKEENFLKKDEFVDNQNQIVESFDEIFSQSSLDNENELNNEVFRSNMLMKSFYFLNLFLKNKMISLDELFVQSESILNRAKKKSDLLNWRSNKLNYVPLFLKDTTILKNKIFEN